MSKPESISAYIGDAPVAARERLEKLRAAVHRLAPGAEELISYGMPAFRYKGLLIWFAAHTHHIGLYPHRSAITFFAKELSAYKTAKGSIQFPYEKPLPMALINRIIRFRVKENDEKETRKKSVRKRVASK